MPGVRYNTGWRIRCDKAQRKDRWDFVSAHENGNRPSIGKITRRGIARHYDEISKAAFVQLLIRVAVVAPLLFCQTMGGQLPDILAAGASLAVYVFILIPMRFCFLDIQFSFFFLPVTGRCRAKSYGAFSIH